MGRVALLDESNMTPGLREHRSASLRISNADCLPEDMREFVREILSVQSTNPRKGHATALLWEVCCEADKWWIMLMVQPRKFADGMPDDKLLPWYGKFGFVKIQDEPCVLMTRSPQAPKIQAVH